VTNTERNGPYENIIIHHFQFEKIKTIIYLFKAYCIYADLSNLESICTECQAKQSEEKQHKQSENC